MHSISKAIKNSIVVLVIVIVGSFFILSPTLGGVDQKPSKVHAQGSITSAIGSGLGKGIGVCIGNIATQLITSATAGKAAGLAFVNPPTGIPTFDPSSQISQGQDAFGRLLREGCLDALAYFVAQETLNQLADDTLSWVQSGFTQFGQDGQNAFIGDIDSFLTNVTEQSFNRFLQDVKSGNTDFKEVCKAFSGDVLEGVAKKYYEENDTPSGVEFDPSNLPSKDDIAASGCDIAGGDGSLKEFINGNFEEGGWKAFYKTIEDPNASPVGAYLEQNQQLQERLEQARSTNLQELQNNDGWVSDITCPNSGGLDESTGRCGDGSEPVVQTPGSVVNNMVNQTVGSGQRQLELADETNEIVAALIDQLVAKVTGTGTSGGAQSGVFADAAQEASTSGDLEEYAESGYESGFQADYASSTLTDQIALEKDLRTVIQDLPSTNKIDKVRTRARQCIRNNKLSGPGENQEVEGLIKSLTAVENNVFPPQEGSRETQSAEGLVQQAQENPEEPLNSGSESDPGLQKIDWLGNKAKWEYGEAQGLKRCETFIDAYNISYVPKRNSSQWERFICVPANGSQFNEKSNQFEGEFIRLPSYLEEVAQIPQDRPLYRTNDMYGDFSPNKGGAIKIDWQGADFEWKHHDPLAMFSTWGSEDTAKEDDNETEWTNSVFFQGKISRTSGVPTGKFGSWEDDELHVNAPGPTLDQGEAEKIDQIGQISSKENRYGTQKCDGRTEGDMSYIVKPFDNKWTFQECKKFTHRFKMNSGDRNVNEIITHYRFVDIPLSEYPNGEKPDAFRKSETAVDSFQGLIEKINALIGNNNYDDSYAAPEFEKDNLRELKHDLTTINENLGPNESVDERKQKLDERFGRMEGRFHSEDDLKAASNALKELNPDIDDSVMSQLININKADNNNCQLPDGYQPPVSNDGSGDGGGGNNDGGLEISEFSVNKVDQLSGLIRISWSASADQCSAINNPNISAWNNQSLPVSGDRVYSYGSNQSITLTIQCSSGNNQTTDTTTFIPSPEL